MGDSPCCRGGHVDDGAWTNSSSWACRQDEQRSGAVRRGAVFPYRTEQSIPVVCRAYSPDVDSALRDHWSVNLLERGSDRVHHARPA